MGKLGLVAPLEEGFQTALEAQFTEAQDDFFSGEHQAAEQGFESIIKKAHGRPNSLLPPSPIRELVFKAHIYRAILAKGDGNLDRTREHIRRAANRFVDLTPASVDFPPWVVKAFRVAKEEMGVIEDIPLHEDPDGRHAWNVAVEWTQDDIANAVGRHFERKWWKKQEAINKAHYE